MKKKYENGLIIGKFEPPHNGHLYLIDQSLNYCDVIHVMICYKKDDIIPGKFRYESLRYIYSINPNVYIYDVEHNLPNYPNESKSIDEFYNLWIEEIYKYIKKLDIVITSTSYGEEFSKYLKLDHILIGDGKFDESGVCRTIPISATAIRENPYNYWEYIPNIVKSLYINKIVLTGPESSGKTILSERLSKYYNTDLISEYARYYFDKNNLNGRSKEKFNLIDIYNIAIGQIHNEDKITYKSDNKLFIYDTDLITTQIWSELYFGYCPKWIIDESYRRKYDLYLLMDIDFDWVDDGTREFSDKRIWHFNRIKQELEKRRINYEVIGGNIEERLKKSISLINDITIKPHF